MKDAFDRPFRNGGTSTLVQSQAQADQDASNMDADTGTIQAPAGQRAPPDVRMPPSIDKGKGKERAIDDEGEISSPSPPPTLTFVVPRSKAPSRAQRTIPREESPQWDIELDITTPSPPTQVRQAPKRGREDSPMWDIELDLNPSDVEEVDLGREAKRRR